MVSPLKSKVYFIADYEPLQIKKVYIILQSIQAEIKPNTSISRVKQ